MRRHFKAERCLQFQRFPRVWHDPFFLLADYQSYVDCQDQVSALWSDQESWTRKSILNVARMGKFSADRSIGEYCEQIWKVEPVHVEVG